MNTLKPINLMGGTEKLKYALEHMIDQSSFECVLEACREIAYEKAEHVLTNWPSQPHATDLEELACKLQFAIKRAKDLGL